MGVQGLWRLIEPSGKPVPLEALENKILAIDISIWLHQAVKGFQDAKGGTIQNSHLLGVYHRLCKLLYFKIKPIFVFDGGVPALKRQTIAKRNQIKSKNLDDANIVQKQLLSSLLKHSAINAVLSDKAKASLENDIKKASNSSNEDIYEIPLSQTEESDSSEDDTHIARHWDLHTIDEKSKHFKSLPANIRHEILTDLKETRKQSSWGRLHEMPTKSDDFAGYQMRRLLKRHSVQVSLEEVEKEMGGYTLSLEELENLLASSGVIESINVQAKRIASDENKRYIYIKSLKDALEKVKEKSSDDDQKGSNDDQHENELETEKSKSEDVANVVDTEYERDLKEAIKLSLQGEASTSKEALRSDVSSDEEICFSDTTEEEVETSNVLSSAMNYMTEYSGLTPAEIAKIINGHSVSKDPKKDIIKTGVTEEKNINFKKLLAQPIKSDGIKRTKSENSETNLYTTEKGIVSVLKGAERDITPDENEKPSPEQSLKLNDETSQIIISDSDSEDGDFVEVEATSSSQPKQSPNPFEIRIEKVSELEDDIFGDVFNGKEQAEKSSVEPPKSPPVISKGENGSKETPEVALICDEHENKEVEEENIRTKVLEPAKDALTTKDLKKMQQDLERERDRMTYEKSTKERLASNITEQMCLEVQELLQLFGVPYIIAPMEAEAQCGFLEEIGLTDGTITDDSDIWLFGGKTVYKNFFNLSKNVMEFQSKTIEESFRLSRREMILLALLVGSDYTSGVKGIGPVTALEILAAFPPCKTDIATLNYIRLLSGLREFKRWLNTEDKAGAKKFSKSTLRKKLKNIEITEQFPSLQVVQAYLEPTVETSKETFSWQKPDKDSLMEFARQKFGWNQTKSEKILDPILRRLEDTSAQTKITNYFKMTHKIQRSIPEDKMSKRVKKAVNKMGDGDDSEVEVEIKKLKSDEDVQVLTRTKKLSRNKVREMKIAMNEMLLRAESSSSTSNVKTTQMRKTRAKEKIPQKERERTEALNKKLKAIEVFRKSKQGPGYVKGRQKTVREPKKDVELSENSDS